jgi:hypothetical protein
VMIPSVTTAPGANTPRMSYRLNSFIGRDSV